MHAYSPQPRGRNIQKQTANPQGGFPSRSTASISTVRLLPASYCDCSLPAKGAVAGPTQQRKPMSNATRPPQTQRGVLFTNHTLLALVLLRIGFQATFRLMWSHFRFVHMSAFVKILSPRHCSGFTGGLSVVLGLTQLCFPCPPPQPLLPSHYG